MSNAIIVLYDVTNQESFNDVQFWCNSIRTQCSQEPKLLLVGNKADDPKKRTVPATIAAEYATLNKMRFTEVSAKNPTSINQLLLKITALVLDPEAKTEEPEREKHVLTLGEDINMECSHP